jgi:hypothetical protein
MWIHSDGFEALMEKDRKTSEEAQNARRGGGSKDMGMEAEQTAFLLSQSVPTTVSDAKYSWHCAPEAKVCLVMLCYVVFIIFVCFIVFIYLCVFILFYAHNYTLIAKFVQHE